MTIVALVIQVTPLLCVANNGMKMGGRAYVLVETTAAKILIDGHVVIATETRIGFLRMERYQNHLFAAMASAVAASKDLGVKNLVQETVMEVSRSAGEIATVTVTVTVTGDEEVDLNKRQKKSQCG